MFQIISHFRYAIHASSLKNTFLQAYKETALRKYEFDESISPETEDFVRSLFAQDAFQVFPETLKFAPLSGGFNNTNLVLEDGTQKWVLKIRPEDYAIFGADPLSSIRVQSYAAAKGLAGDVLAVDSTGLHFVSAFLEGETVRPELARQAGLMPEVVAVLHQLHPGPCICSKRSFFDDIRLFMKGVNANGISVPEGFEHMLSTAFEIEQALNNASPPQGVCHNDLVPQNFIRSGKTLKLVDFDYAGIGLIAAEMSSAASQFELTECETENFLQLYDPCLDDGQRARVAVLGFCNNLREISFTLFAEPLLAGQTDEQEGFSIVDHREFNMAQAKAKIIDPIFAEHRAAMTSIRPGATF